jgi:hypothetical protein
MSRPLSAAGPLTAGAPHSPALLAGIAVQLATFAEDAEAFGIVLCSDYDVATRYLVQLQQIDRLSQCLREMANVLLAEEPDTAVAAIRLGELRHTLERIDAR